ncbi:6848_t:CDS:2 [Entrophospora sp. SA101]|nr:10344_t:CDS:2 [Entrophospora sp. SA101]CAJ0862106.1 6848_t:CDS:2 [Entrophospora sp. SA101]CAJ0876671.1 8681_t:CDS:2 [Entrophospora sp. SA101]CAJ0895920.1 12355_t:CDS:2 [Entrophospora sp. SA101]
MSLYTTYSITMQFSSIIDYNFITYDNDQFVNSNQQCQECQEHQKIQESSQHNEHQENQKYLEFQEHQEYSRSQGSSQHQEHQEYLQSQEHNEYSQHQEYSQVQRYQIDISIRLSQMKAMIYGRNVKTNFLEWFPRDQLYILDYIGTCEFGISYKAILWLNGGKRLTRFDYENYYYNDDFGFSCVAVKIFNDVKHFIDAVKRIYFIMDAISGKSDALYNMFKYYGVVLFPELNKYGIVMQYCNGGSLTQYMNQNWSFTSWKNKLEILLDIASALNSLHKEGLIHGSLNSDTVLISSSLDSSSTSSNAPKAYLNDLKYCKHIDKFEKHPEGLMYFTAPELLMDRSKPFSKKVDIYSFGMIMYHVATSQLPYASIDNRLLLEFFVFNGIKPVIPSGLTLPNYYHALIQRCISRDSNKRPDIKDIIYNLSAWILCLTNSESPSIQIT